MRTLTVNELDLVHGGVNDGKWHWIDIGHNGQGIGVEPPATIGYRTPNVLLGSYGFQGIVSYNAFTHAYNLSINATNGGPIYNFNVGSSGGGGSFTDNFNNGNSVSFVVDITASGDIGMLQLQFVHDFNRVPEATHGIGRAYAPSVR